MTLPRHCVHIAGDFVHSFIYSGTLFFVGTDSVVRTYHWENLVAETVQKGLDDSRRRLGVFEFLKDSRTKLPWVRDEDGADLWVDERELKRHLVGELQLAGWPTDINVYANRLYTADERGVLETAFLWSQRRIDGSNQLRLLHERAFSVSPNDAHRVAIAAGPNGVFSAAPNNKDFVARRDLFRVLEVESYDCEWMDQVLVANSDAGPYTAAFAPLPEFPTGDAATPEAWRAYSTARRREPNSKGKIQADGAEVMYAWLGGSKVFNLLQDGRLLIADLEQDTPPAAAVRGTEYVSDAGLGVSLDLQRFTAARSASFGSIAEVGDSLLALSEHGAELVCEKPVSWRVFPRAKNYLSHLHVIADDAAHIYAFLPMKEDGESDRLGLDIKWAEGDTKRSS